MVATLQAAVAFAAALHAAAPQLERLLASDTASDVPAAIKLLTIMKAQGIEPAEAGLHRMLALVFSKDAAVRDAVLGACKARYFEVCSIPVAHRHAGLGAAVKSRLRHFVQVRVTGLHVFRRAPQSLRAQTESAAVCNLPHTRSSLPCSTKRAVVNPLPRPLRYSGCACRALRQRLQHPWSLF